MLEHRELRRYFRNVLLSQKRFAEAQNITDEAFQEFLDNVDTDTVKRWYVNGTIELDVLETILDFKFGLG